MALDSNQLSDMQGDLGITTDQAVFTDTELNRLFDRAASDYNTAVYLAFRQLLADSAKFFNYTAGQTRIEREAVFQHVKSMVDFWKDESRTAGNQVKIVGATQVPPQWKDTPYETLPRRLRNATWWPQ